MSDESERRGLANHEAGHAVVAAFTRFWPLWLLIFLGLAGLVLIVEFSTTFISCLDKGPGLLTKPLVQLESRRQCLGTFVEKNNGAITALAGVVVAIFTVTLWWSTRTQYKHMREVERAYIWGGGPIVRSEDGSRSLALTVNNYGKTPGRLTEFAVGFCPRDNIPSTPQYSVRQRHHDWIRPDPKANWLIGMFQITQRDPLIFGRLWFRDVWEEPHSIGFVLVTVKDPETGEEGTSAVIPSDIAANIGRAYTEWH